MTSRPYRFALLELHLAVLLFGLAGVLGKAIDAGAVMIVLGRSAVAAMALGTGLLLSRHSLGLPTFGRPALAASGLLLAVHWLSFFHAINISSVAVGVVGFATFPIFVTLLEPMLGGPGLRWIDGITALAVFCGLYLVAGPGQTDALLPALTWAVFSGFTFALLTLLNRHLVQQHSYLLVAFYQQAGAAACLLPVALALDGQLSASDLLLIVVLGLACSALAQTLFVKSLDRVRAQLASVVTGLEPVYAIGLAAVFLGDQPGWLTVIGAGIVLAAVTAASLAHRER